MSAQTDIPRTVRRTIVGVVGMFGFAFALVPLYDVICEVTGLNGKTGDAYAYVEADLEADRSRLVSIRFVTNNNAGMPWGFGSSKTSMRVNPGGINEAIFHAHNPTDRIMVAQTIPSVVPGRAATFFHKTQCFCFDQQVLMPGEAVEMPVRFIVDRDLPRSVDAITLSYTMFDITDQAAGRAALAEYRASRTDGATPGAELAGGETAGN